MITDPTLLAAAIAAYFAALIGIGVREIRHKRIDWLGMLLWILAVWPILWTLASPRNLDYAAAGSRGWHMAFDPPAILAAAGRISFLVVVLCGLAGLLRYRKTRLPPWGYALWATFLLLASGPLLAGFLGSGPSGLSPSLLRSSVVMTAVYLLAAQSGEAFIPWVKRVCLAYVIGSLAAAILAPAQSVLTGASGLVEGFGSRLFGLAANANALAPLALLYLLLEAAGPTASKARRLFQALAFLVLLWAQSRTIWLAGLASLAVLFWHRTGTGNGGNAPQARGLRYVVLAGLVLLALALTWLDGVRAPQVRGIDTEALGDLTGRGELWAITLDEWERAPFFGYGPSIWNEEYRSQHLSSTALYASHAHNAYVQVLGDSGLFGLVGLAAFLTAMAVSAWRSAAVSGGVSLCLAVFLAVRCLGESAIRSADLDEAMFLNAALFGAMIVWEKARSPVSRPADPLSDLTPCCPGGANKP